MSGALLDFNAVRKDTLEPNPALGFSQGTPELKLGAGTTLRLSQSEQYIALEFGQMHRRFGSQVTAIERGPRVVSREDEDISTAVREIVESDGVRVMSNTGGYRVERRGDGIAVKFVCENRATEVAGSHLPVATGRVPNTHDLGLDRAGVSKPMSAA